MLSGHPCSSSLLSSTVQRSRTTAGGFSRRPPVDPSDSVAPSLTVFSASPTTRRSSLVSKLLRTRTHRRIRPVCPDTPPLHDNPVFLYFEDGFQRPNPFRPDVAVAIDDVFDKKIDALDAHVSQVYEWLPWVDHTLNQVPKDVAERKKWLASRREPPVSPAVRKALEKWYGAERAAQVKVAESFELCEYGRRPTDEELRKLFPMLGK